MSKHAKMTAMHGERGQGHVNIMVAFVVIGLAVATVWIWKRLSYDAQDYIVEQAVPVALGVLLVLVVVWTMVSKVRGRRAQLQRRERLKARFLRETVADKRRDLAFALIEVNQYRLMGLEEVAPSLIEVLTTTLKTARGDKQHRIRGMAASYLGVLQDRSVVPLLVKALDDDHAHVRACAALGLGRLRAAEATDKLACLMQEDWDQTVRSRAREALERMA